MSRWFRHYAGMMRDDKLVRVALRSGQPIERVAWVWGAILESAAEIDNGGQYDFDHGEAAYFLRAEEDHVRAITESLEQLGRLHDGRVAKWGARQFQSDRSSERQRRHRNGKPGKADRQPGDAGGTGDGGVTATDRHVTAESRHRDAPETDTESEQKDDGGSGQPATAIEIATELAAVCGYPTPVDWPPGWCGAPHWVQKCLNEGWVPAVMVSETRAVAKRKRDGPIDNYIYLEKPLARAQARHAAPLPKVEIVQQETIYETARGRNAGGNELSRVIRGLREGSEESRSEIAGKPPPRLLSHG